MPICASSLAIAQGDALAWPLHYASTGDSVTLSDWKDGLTLHEEHFIKGNGEWE